jgi:hypothetical protein
MDRLQSHYRINVATVTSSHRTGGGQTVDCVKHFFAVDVIGENNARKVYESLRINYPKDRFTVDVTFWDIVGKSLDFEK